MLTSFALGQTVQWTSSASGKTTSKHGKIVAIIPAGAYPHPIAETLSSGKYSLAPLRGFGLPRNEDTYLVAVEGIGKAKSKLYWPRVSSLTLSQTQESEAA